MLFSSPKFLAEILIEYGMFCQSVWHHTSGEEGDFFILSEQDLARVLSFAKFFTNFVASWELSPRHYIFDESVFAFILDKKSDSFKQRRGYDNTHFLYSYVAIRILRIYPILSKCGVL